MKRRFIRQLIVVEGRHDTANLQKYFDCDTAETGGTSLDEKVMERIAYAAETRGVIIFTDPDSPGNRIRNAINRRIPGCGNAFIEKEKARTDRKVGVEHAGREALEEAGTNLTGLKLRGIITFILPDWGNELTFLYTAQTDSAELKECSEGVLKWIPITEVMYLPLWEGDRIFLPLLLTREDVFSLKLNYEPGGRLSSWTIEPK